jgi:hypothetical protein
MPGDSNVGMASVILAGMLPCVVDIVGLHAKLMSLESGSSIVSHLLM